MSYPAHDEESHDGYFLAHLWLGWTDMGLTRTGFGAWAISRGGWANAWRCRDGTESSAAVRAAADDAGSGPALPPLAAPPRQ